MDLKLRLAQLDPVLRERAEKAHKKVGASKQSGHVIQDSGAETSRALRMAYQGTLIALSAADAAGAGEGDEAPCSQGR